MTTTPAEQEQAILDALAETDELRSDALQAAIGDDAPLRTRLDRLIKNGQVTRRKDPRDRRRTLYSLAETDVPGDDAESAYTYPRECRCGATLDSSLEWRVHRTEAHGVALSDYDNYEPGEFESVVAQADSIDYICEETGWSMVRVMRLLGIYGIGVGDGEATSSVVERGPGAESAVGLPGTDRAADIVAGRTQGVSVDVE